MDIEKLSRPELKEQLTQALQREEALAKQLGISYVSKLKTVCINLALLTIILSPVLLAILALINLLK